MAFIKKTSRVLLIAFFLLTLAELTFTFTNQFSSSVDVMANVVKQPDKVASINGGSPDLAGALSEVINLNPAAWHSYLESLQLRLQTLTLDSLFNDLLNLGDSPFGWIVMGLVGWQVIWKLTGQDSAVKL